MRKAVVIRTVATQPKDKVKLYSDRRESIKLRVLDLRPQAQQPRIALALRHLAKERNNAQWYTGV
jgi:hypothetical protein